MTALPPHASGVRYGSVHHWRCWKSRALMALDTFINPNSSSWSTASNWSLNRVPEDGDSVDIPANVSVSSVQSISLTSLSIEGTLNENNQSVSSTTVSSDGTLKRCALTASSISGSGTLIDVDAIGATLNDGITIITSIYGTTLDGVTLDGNHEITGGVRVEDGLTLNGTIFLSGGGGGLNCSSSTTQINGVGIIEIEEPGTSSNVAEGIFNAVSLTIGSQISVLSQVGFTQLGSGLGTGIAKPGV